MILSEAFRELDTLNEETFSLDKEGIEELDEFEKDDTFEDVEDIIDPNAETEDDLQDSYVGKVILDCCICHSKQYKDKEDVILNEDQTLANTEEECPFCYSTDGFKVIGQVSSFDEEEKEEETDEQEDLTDDSLSEGIFSKKQEKTVTPDKVKKGDIIKSYGRHQDINGKVKSVEDKGNQVAIYHSAGNMTIGKDRELTILTSREIEDDLTESLLLESKLGDSIKKIATRLGADAATIIRAFAEELPDFIANPAADMEEKAVAKALMNGNEKVLNGTTIDDLEELQKSIEETKQNKDTKKSMKNIKEPMKVLIQKLSDDQVEDNDGHEWTAHVYSHFEDGLNKFANEYKADMGKFHKGDIEFKIVDQNTAAKLTGEDIIKQDGNSYDNYVGKSGNRGDTKSATGAEIEEGLFSKREQKTIKASQAKKGDIFVSAPVWGTLEDEMDSGKPWKISGVTEEDGKIYISMYSGNTRTSIYLEPDEDITISTKRNIKEDFEEDELEEGIFNNDAKNIEILQKSLNLDAGSMDGIANQIIELFEDAIRYMKPPKGKNDKYDVIDDMNSKVFKAESIPEHVLFDFVSLCELYRIKPVFAREAKFFNELDKISNILINPSANGVSDIKAFFKAKKALTKILGPKVKETLKSAIKEKTQDWGLYESIRESIENLSMDTDDTHMEMTSDDSGKVTITTEPRKDTSGEETIEPINDETKEEIETNSEESDTTEGEEVDVEVDEFEEESFDELGESYLKKIYGNVDSFKTTNVSSTKDRLIIEGLIKFNSGKSKNTTFIFESKSITKNGKVKFLGENKEITKGKKAFIIKGSIQNKKLITESLTYNYNVKNKDNKTSRLYGTVKTQKRG